MLAPDQGERARDERHGLGGPGVGRKPPPGASLRMFTPGAASVTVVAP